MPKMGKQNHTVVIFHALQRTRISLVPGSSRAKSAQRAANFFLAGAQQGIRNGMTSINLDCYWVGSLDFNFLVEIKGFPLNTQKVKLFAGASLQQPRNHPTGGFLLGNPNTVHCQHPKRVIPFTQEQAPLGAEGFVWQMTLSVDAAGRIQGDGIPIKRKKNVMHPRSGVAGWVGVGVGGVGELRGWGVGVGVGGGFFRGGVEVAQNGF